MTGFGFKCDQKVHDHQKDIFTTNRNTIQATLESLQESQRNDYFCDKLTTNPNENLRIINLNINGLNLGKANTLYSSCVLTFNTKVSTCSAWLKQMSIGNDTI